MIDFGWPWTADTHSIAEKMRLLEPTAQIWMKIDQNYHRQKCRPMTSSWIYTVHCICRYSQGFLGEWASNDSEVINDANFWRFSWPLLRKLYSWDNPLSAYRARQKNNPLGKIRYLWNCCRFFRQIYSIYRGRLEPHILRILLQYLVAFKNYNHLNLNVHF